MYNIIVKNSSNIERKKITGHRFKNEEVRNGSNVKLQKKSSLILNVQQHNC